MSSPGYFGDAESEDMKSYTSCGNNALIDLGRKLSPVESLDRGFLSPDVS